ncbi:MAG: hypothetical protein H6620_07425 [Halobacteriovoraceae bacterium]|nr:hypothetical protein [Halobacteriovoraceae bacterium]
MKLKQILCLFLSYIFITNSTLYAQSTTDPDSTTSNTATSAPAGSCAYPEDLPKIGNGAAEQISLAIAGTLGTQLPMVCKKGTFTSPALAIYFTGALAYYIMEIVAITKLKKNNKEIFMDQSQTDEEDADLTMHKSQQKSNKEALKALNIRFAGSMTMTTTALVATILSIVEEIQLDSPLPPLKALAEQLYVDDNCQEVQSSDADTTTTDVASNNPTDNTDLNNGATEIDLDTNQSAFSSETSQGHTADTNQGTLSEKNLTSKTEKKNITKDVKGSDKKGMGLVGMLTSVANMCSLLGFIGGEETTAMSMTCMALNLGLSLLEKPFSNMMKRPGYRAVFFGVSSALSIAATSVVGVKRGKLKERNDKTQEYIDCRENNITNAGTSNERVVSSGVGTGNYSSLDVGNDTYNWDIPDDPSYLPAGTDQTRIPEIKKFKGFDSPTLYSAVQDIQDMATYAKSGSYKKASLAASNLNSKAAKLKKIKEELLKKLNDQRAQQGKKPFDLDSLVAAKAKKLQSQIQEATGMASSLADDSTANLNEAAKIAKEEAPNNVQVREPSRSTASVAGGKGSNLFSEDSFLSDTESSGDQYALDDKAFDSFQVDHADIQKKPEKSIFKSITIRYLKTAYPQLLRKK